VLLADRKNCPEPQNHAVAASYAGKGTLRTLANIIRHRGVFGLYTGFRLHLCELAAAVPLDLPGCEQAGPLTAYNLQCETRLAPAFTSRHTRAASNCSRPLAETAPIRTPWQSS
jgi:hypothetical protein